MGPWWRAVVVVMVVAGIAVRVCSKLRSRMGLMVRPVEGGASSGLRGGESVPCHGLCMCVKLPPMSVGDIRTGERSRPVMVVGLTARDCVAGEGEATRLRSWARLGRPGLRERLWVEGVGEKNI